MTKLGVDDAHAAGITADELEQRATKEPPGGVEPGRPSQASLLIALVDRERAELTHDREGTPHVTLTRDGHRETHRLKSKPIRDWFAAAYYKEYGSAANAQAIADAIATLSGRACFEGKTVEVHVRLAGHDGAIYLDLGNDAWQIVRITSVCWSIIEAAEAPVRFRRPKGMLPLPTPALGGAIATLDRFINVKREDDRRLIDAWLLGSLRPKGPYPILVLFGEQGAAKSTTARILRALVDPHAAPLRSEPREEADLLIAAVNGWYVMLDNLSRISDRLSDAFCRLATGGAISKRELYSDADEVFLDAQRPVVLTGIEAVVTRGDAVDRSLLVELDRISDDSRRTEATLWAEFEKERPALLGALLDAASMALKREASMNLAWVPRLADFATWVEAGASAFGWERDEFLQVYGRNRSGADELALDALPIGAVVREFIQTQDGGTWSGTATQLLAALTDKAGDISRARDWPKKPNSLSGNLKRLAPNLRRLGISYDNTREPGGKQRTITLSYTPPPQEERNSSSQASQASQASHARNGAENSVTVDEQGSSQSDQSSSQTPGGSSQGRLPNPRNGANNGHRVTTVTTVTTNSPPFQNQQPARKPDWSTATRVPIG